MEKIGIINQREIFYLQQREHPAWHHALPESNWLLFAVANEEDVHNINELSEKCLDKNVSYICGTGHIGSTIEDSFDLECLNRKIRNATMPVPSSDDEAPHTSWHENFDEGFWFAATAARHQILPITKVVCIILSKGNYKHRISSLIDKINSGWLPRP